MYIIRNKAALIVNTANAYVIRKLKSPVFGFWIPSSVGVPNSCFNVVEISFITCVSALSVYSKSTILMLFSTSTTLLFFGVILKLTTGIFSS